MPTELAEEARLTEIADGVYAYEQTPGGWCMSNAGVIIEPAGAVVVDTLATLRRATRLRGVVDELAPGRRRVVVNTHHHGDHIFGNQMFATAAIIGHERATEEITATGLALTRLWPDVDWGELELTPPTVTFSDNLALRAGDRRVELIYAGPAHTSNDIVVWLPDERVLFAGDVVMSGCTPFALMGSIAGSLVAIERLARLAPRIVVCGHGPVAGPKVLGANAAYLRWIQKVAEHGIAAGLTPLRAAMDVPLADFADLLDPERIVGNLYRAYTEAQSLDAGAKLDAGGELDASVKRAEDVYVAAAFADMVAYNGGKRPTCLA